MSGDQENEDEYVEEYLYNLSISEVLKGAFPSWIWFWITFF